jgi:sugar phosphate isomerase/epimerase
MTQAQFKRGVSIYSFQEKYYRGEMSLRDCIATTAEMGCTGVEVVADQMLPGYPSITYNLSDEFVASWHQLLQQYSMQAVALDVYGETKLYRHRAVTQRELLDQMLALLKTAKVLGFDILRLTFHLPLDVVEALIPYAEDAGVRLALEVHAPHRLDGEWVQRNLELIARKQTKYLGLMPDLGIFCRDIPHLVLDNSLRAGAQPRVVDFLHRCYRDGRPADWMQQLEAMAPNEADLWLAKRVEIGVWLNDDPKRLREVMPHVFHIHGKFYEMNGQGIEPEVKYDEIMPILIEQGYAGYICSEYEGQRLIHGVDLGYDEVEQVRRHQAMLQRYMSNQ